MLPAAGLPACGLTGLRDCGRPLGQVVVGVELAEPGERGLLDVCGEVVGAVDDVAEAAEQGVRVLPGVSGAYSERKAEVVKPGSTMEASGSSDSAWRSSSSLVRQ